MGAPHERWWWVSLPYATFGLCADASGRVVEAAPIARWARDKPIAEVLACYRRKGAEVLPLGLTAEQLAEIERQERLGSSLDYHAIIAGGNKLVNRSSIFEMRKSRFIERFLADGAIDAYPCADADVEDENAEVDYTGMTLREALVAQVRRAFLLCDGPTSIDSTAVASELLKSEHGLERCHLRRIPLAELSVPMVLAHLETLAFGLDKRLSASIARRAFVLLLNRERFMPDGRPTR